MNPWFDACTRAIPGALTVDFARIVPGKRGPRCLSGVAARGSVVAAQEDEAMVHASIRSDVVHVSERAAPPVAQ